MTEENKKVTVEEIDTQIKKLKVLKKEVTGKEDFDSKKFTSRFFGLFDVVGWAKWINQFIKTLLVLVLITGIIFGVGYWKGKGSKPVFTDSKDFTMELVCKDTGKKHLLVVKNGKYYFDGKVVTAKDLPALKPYGIELHPKLFAGVGSKGPAVGAGFEFAHFYKLNADVFLMSDKAIYLGVSYDLRMDATKAAMNWFENSAIGLAVGKGLDNPEDTRIMLYWTIRF